MRKLDKDVFQEIFERKNIDTNFTLVSILTLNQYGYHFGLTEPIHWVRFLAQCKHEIMFHRNGQPFTEENLNFSEKTILKLSRYWREKPKELKEALANRDKKTIMNGWYNGRMGNKLDSDDGYNFIGHGAMMITGRANHVKILRAIEQKVDFPLLDENDNLIQKFTFQRIDIFWLMALAFWQENSLYYCQNTNAVTKKVNNGLPVREKEERVKTAIRVKKILAV